MLVEPTIKYVSTLGPCLALANGNRKNIASEKVRREIINEGVVQSGIQGIANGSLGV